MAEGFSSRDHAIARLAGGGCAGEGQRRPPAVSVESVPGRAATVSAGPRLKQIGEKSFPCNLCAKVFRQTGNLKIHARTHTGEKPYSCGFCGKSFTSSNQLTVHRRTHTGEKPYRCAVCGKSFTNNSHLHVHRRVHTGEKPYRCDVCGKPFRQRCHVTSHRRTHADKGPRHRDFCDRACCRHNSWTERGRRTHVDVKLYCPCESCDKDFTADGQLTLHRQACATLATDRTRATSAVSRSHGEDG